jgi:hypothetical protein
MRIMESHRQKTRHDILPSQGANKTGRIGQLANQPPRLGIDHPHRHTDVLPNNLYRASKVGVVADNHRGLKSSPMGQVHQIGGQIHVGSLLTQCKHWYTLTRGAIRQFKRKPLTSALEVSKSQRHDILALQGAKVHLLTNRIGVVTVSLDEDGGVQTQLCYIVPAWGKHPMTQCHRIHPADPKSARHAVMKVQPIHEDRGAPRHNGRASRAT